jgi:uroporphyrinogen-III synthase
MTRVLVLRPEPGASATVKRARERGLDAVAIPLFEIQPVAWDVPDASAFDGLLLTSANAIRWGGDRLTELRGLPVHAVGGATSDAAREAGFDIASTGDAGVERLLGSIEPGLKLLHLAGEDRKSLDGTEQQITAVTVYRSSQTETADLDCAEGIALIHSPRAGRRFAELVDAAAIDRKSLTIAAISREAADAVGQGWAAVEAAEAPNDDALLALTERLCNKAAST